MTASYHQGNRQLHNLALYKQVWIAFVADLHRRFLLDLPCGARLGDYSTDELINVVEHIVNGPSSWTANTTPAPIIARQVILTPYVDHGPGVLNWQNQPQLFPRGAFVFYENWGKPQCWAEEGGKLVWTYKPEVHRWVNTFALESTDGGQGALIVIGIRDYATPYKQRKNYVTLT